MKRKTKSGLIHVIACISFLALPYLFFPHQQDSFNLKNPPTQRDFIGQILLIVFFYLNYYIFIPKLYFTKKYILFIAGVLICFIVVITLPSALTKSNNFHPAPMFDNINNHPPPPPLDHNEFIHQPPPPPLDHNEFIHQPPPNEHRFSINNPQFFLFWIVLFFSLNLRINISRRLLQQEKFDAEVSYLKAQINPHFLFNTLNSIYALSIEKSDKTPEAVTKLANMMRYVLYQSQKNIVLLKNELDYIIDYIELQKIRFGNEVEIIFKIEGNADDKNIAPLILIPFVENAFKYGVNADENSSIIINIMIDNNTLQFDAFNKKVSKQIIESESGLGIENTKQRLKLLYPGKHELSINDKATEFIISLKLDIL